MLRELLLAVAIGVSNIAIHASGGIYLLKFSSVLRPLRQISIPRVLWALACFFLIILTLHVLEAALWAEFYLWRGCFRDRETAYYFSLMTFTTVGYGDVVLPRAWRLVGVLEAMTGVLLFGWSTAMLLALTSRFRDFWDGQNKVRQRQDVH
jgi:voltage-gated potassium channel Kch